ncbi:AtpZ/AtpI family protein [Paenimyroides tangerinum]|uniref:AtpZ/AtpI family protein n=1 Tax=Paenimyroides tangerinum TaxID=2488728 RepID=A0A3P3W3S0_9FLAO|nr:AtpZ/AtpI family protein [Paenimyroides tangerinum]RRJ89067.1 AtpZ/AtpI family protein [Paenimyroides tangerinum]
MNNKQKHKRNKWLALTSIPIQMLVTIYLASRLGVWLDNKYLLNNEIATKVVTLLGVFVALYQVINQVNQINKNE